MDCEICEGRGYIETVSQEWEDDHTPVMLTLRTDCEACGGTGKQEVKNHEQT